MRLRRGMQSGSFAWPLVRAAVFWFAFAEAAELIAPTIETSPKVFAYVAIAGFGVQALGLFLGSVMAYGFSWRIGLIAIVGAGLGFGIFSTLPSIALDTGIPPEWFSQMSESARSAGGILSYVPPLESAPRSGGELGPTAKLVFGKETQESLAAARRYLISIPEQSPAYKSAQALLKVVELRLEEIKPAKDAGAEGIRPIQIVSIGQTGHGLRVTIRNNMGRALRSLRYRVSYFKVADGTLIEPDKESLMLIDVPPRVTWTVELNDERLKQDVYGAFQAISWEVAP